MMSETKTAIFAGGCFWCMEPPFDGLQGVKSVTLGYTGGHTPSPTYEQVCGGGTGHYEAVQVVYDPALVSFEQLLLVFWQQIDPEDDGGQFADRGTQYRAAIFYSDEQEKRIAEESKLRVEKLLNIRAAVRILPVSKFYPAESYHCAYSQKNPAHYNGYKKGSGRAGYLERVWGDAALRSRLSPMAYSVTKQAATESPFAGEYWDNGQEGIYVDVVTAEPLFSARAKFYAGCGWPSFTKPIDTRSITNRPDKSHGMIRTEVKSKVSDAHLGHVFDDGPAPGGQRYCINSAALRFIPKDALEEEGYGSYKSLFE